MDGRDHPVTGDGWDHPVTGDGWDHPVMQYERALLSQDETRHPVRKKCME